jgi:1-aminocyclopropane-1-carboxylate deaminase/D-cysteine desulfhydrase-like pyridoxal-dependent ACC family enzyme
MTTLTYRDTPVLELPLPAAQKAGVRLLVKREDLNHQSVSGNKWWKLKYNIAAVQQTQHRTMLTFGGAYSNHISATAAASRELGLKSIGIIRGEKSYPLNPVLSKASENGMQLQYVTREDYRRKSEKEFLANLCNTYGAFYVIPEGGSNVEAVKGCDEFARTVLVKTEFDYLALAVGTGGTMAGIISGFEGKKKILGVPVLKNGGFLASEIQNLLKVFSGRVFENWYLLTDYHHGGYAKVTRHLLSFIDEIQRQYDLPLDHVYMGKLLWAIGREIDLGKFPRGSTILVLHSGGLPGLKERAIVP